MRFRETHSDHSKTFSMCLSHDFSTCFRLPQYPSHTFSLSLSLSLLLSGPVFLALSAGILSARACPVFSCLWALWIGWPSSLVSLERETSYTSLEPSLTTHLPCMLNHFCLLRVCMALPCTALFVRSIFSLADQVGCLLHESASFLRTVSVWFTLESSVPSSA